MALREVPSRAFVELLSLPCRSDIRGRWSRCQRRPTLHLSLQCSLGRTSNGPCSLHRPEPTCCESSDKRIRSNERSIQQLAPPAGLVWMEFPLSRHLLYTRSSGEESQEESAEGHGKEELGPRKSRRHEGQGETTGRKPGRARRLTRMEEGKCIANQCERGRNHG